MKKCSVWPPDPDQSEYYTIRLFCINFKEPSSMRKTLLLIVGLTWVLTMTAQPGQPFQLKSNQKRHQHYLSILKPDGYQALEQIDLRYFDL